MKPLNDRELATVLAALRYWQGLLLENAHVHDCGAIATDNGVLKPLEVDEIDALCERLNTTG